MAKPTQVQLTIRKSRPAGAGGFDTVELTVTEALEEPDDFIEVADRLHISVRTLINGWLPEPPDPKSPRTFKHPIPPGYPEGKQPQRIYQGQ
jgi:hypothetical protein